MNRLAAICLAWLCAAAVADSQPRVHFSIPAQSLSTALIEFANQARVQVLTAGQEVSGARAGKVDGRLTLDDALERLLKGSGFTYRFVDATTVTIIRAGSRESEVKTGADESNDVGRSLRLVSFTPVAATNETPPDNSGLPRAEGSDMVIFGERVVTRNRENTVEPVLVYSAGYFERFEPLTLNDMLKRVPGVYFDRLFNLPNNSTGTTFADTSGTMPRFRNLDSQFSQILVNGRRIAGIDFGSGGDAFLQTIPAEAVKEIRVIRSPSAAIDSSGVGMTLDVILKQGAGIGDNSWRMAMSYVDHELEPLGSVTMHRNYERWSWSVSATAQDRFGSGFSINDSDSDTVLALGTTMIATRTLSQSRTISRQFDEDRSVVGTLAFDVGRTGALELEGRYVDSGYESTVSTARDSDTTRTQQVGGTPPVTTRTFQSTLSNGESVRDSLNYGAAVRYSQNVTDMLRWSTVAGYDRTDFESAHLVISDNDGNPFPSNISSAEGKGERFQFNNHLSWKFSNGQELRFGADLQRSDERNYNASRTNQTPDSGFDTVFSQDRQTIERTDLFSVYEWRLGNGLNLQIGARQEMADYDSDAPPELVMTADVREAFQFDPTVIDPTSRTQFAASVRGFNPSAHLRWSFSDSQDLRVSVARTVRRPHLGELDPRVYITASADGILPNEVQVGNPELKNEEAWGFDVGYDWRVPDGVVGINVFHRRIENLIEQSIISPERFAEIRPDLTAEIERFALFMAQTFPTGGPVLTTSVVNTENTTRVRGVELDLSFPLSFFSRNAHIYANATWSKRKTSGQPSVEASAVNFSYDHFLEMFNFTYGVGVNWITKSKSHSELLGSLITDGERELEPNLEVFLEKKFGDRLLARLTMENATDALDESRTVNQFLGISTGTQINNRLTQSDPRVLFTVRGKF